MVTFMRNGVSVYRNLKYRSTSNVGPCTFKQSAYCSSQGNISTGADDMPDLTVQNPFTKEPVKCIMCQHNIKVDYKNIKLLSQFVSPYTGIVYNKHITGLCDAQQKLVQEAIKKARSAGLMAYYLKELRFVKDPKLFDPFRPQRPHPH